MMRKSHDGNTANSNHLANCRLVSALANARVHSLTLTQNFNNLTALTVDCLLIR